MARRHNAIEESGRNIYVLSNVTFVKCHVLTFYAYFLKTDPVWFQIWRPHKDLSQLFTLVGQVPFSARVVPGVFKVSRERCHKYGFN